jgi:hypothetical protein
LLRLVVDSTENSQPVYQGALHRKIWEKLSEIGETATFYLGSSSPVSHGNQAPPQGPDRRSRLRLIGPILERLKPESRLLVLTNGPILDLGDFRQSQWRDRLLVVTTDQSYEDAWPHTYVFRLTDDPALAVNLLLSLEDIKSDEELY